MKQYLDLMAEVLAQGETTIDRTGVGTKRLVGQQVRFDLSKGFPAVTTKKLAWKAVVSELLWFMEGSTDERRLAEILHGTRSEEKKTIWTANYKEQGGELGYTNGYTGPIYGKQWRDFEGVDQLQGAIDTILTNPSSRRNIVSAWNPPKLPEMILPPCHLLFQFMVSEAGRLHCVTYQRSCDVLLGLPFNIASYALLMHIVARETDTVPGELVMNLADTHVYLSHLLACEEQLEREPMALPELQFATKPWDLYSLGDFTLKGYKSHPPLTNNTSMVV